MSTPQQEWKRLERRLRYIPVEQVAAEVAAEERDGMWCLVGGGLSFIPADGGTCETSWSDMTQYAMFERYVAAHPERVHATIESARAFVRAAR